MEALQLKTNSIKAGEPASSTSKRLLLPHMPLQFDSAQSFERIDVEQFIADRFAFYYQAEINHFLPYLLSTRNNGKFTAAMGFQPASVSPLFLEQYLSSTIEAEISSITGKPIQRDKVVELGNLTSVHRGTSQILFVLIVAILHKAGFEWAVFTATKQVQSLLSRLDLSTTKICEANPVLLRNGAQTWGSYYDDRPNVIFGNLADAISLLKQHPVTAFMLENYQSTITDIAHKITK